MAQLAIREFYEFVVSANDTFSQRPSNSALKDELLASDFADLIDKIVNFEHDSRDEIFRARFPTQKRTDDLVERIKAIKSLLINSLASRGGTSSTGAILNGVQVERLLSAAEQVENAGIKLGEIPSREQMVGETEAIIAAVKEWDLEDYAKDTLLIQLNNMTRIIQANDSYSDAELRRRVKSIIADFASEFASLDKKHGNYLEQLVGWGKRGFFCGTVLLGLTADVSTIQAALPAPNLSISKD